MKLSRIRFAFPLRIALILALLPCLPLIGFWAWLHWEVPPLQRKRVVWAVVMGGCQSYVST